MKRLVLILLLIPTLAFAQGTRMQDYPATGVTSPDDIVTVVRDPDGTPATYRASIAALFSAGNITISGSNLTFGGNITTTGTITAASFSGTQTITLTGDVTGSGATSFATTLSPLYKGWASFQGNIYTPTITDNVGIGVQTPSAKLHVVGDTVITGSLNVSGTGNITFPNGTALDASVTSKLNISGGNVGIGSTAPGATLDIGASGNMKIPALKSTTGTRYLCIGTTGIISSSASACSGT